VATQLNGPRLSGPTLVKGARASRTTIALKLGMALSGMVFLGFVLAHMYGNLKAFAGHDAFNEYAEHLREIGEPMLPHGGLLWILRVGLIASLVVHVYCAVVLWRRAAKARTTKYVVKKDTGATGASVNSLSGGQSASVKATVLTAAGKPAANVIVQFSATNRDLVSFTPETGSALTDANGVAVVSVKPVSVKVRLKIGMGSVAPMPISSTGLNSKLPSEMSPNPPLA